MTFDNTHFSEKPPKHHSTALNNFDAAISSGETSVSEPTLTANTSNTKRNTSNSDDTTNVLRKILLQNLIQNPRTFQGGKDDVTKWLEGLEHSFELAHIPDTNKIDLVSYSLRGEALRWFKNNKNTFTAWESFVLELKKAFTSSYHAELAFKILEAYSQGENQSIRNFYNETLKLCKDADPTMSESAKLRFLLSKTKPTIQFEVRRKKPTTTKEFLEYAKEIEDLYQLSNISTNTINNSILDTINSSTTNTPTTMNNYNKSYSTKTQPPPWKQQYSTSLPSQQNNNAPNFRPYQQKSSSNYRNNSFNNYRSYNNNQSTDYQRTNIPTRNASQPNKLNSLFSSDSLTQPTTYQTTDDTNQTTLQNTQLGYQADAHPSF